jgi:pyruvate,water dikinase
MKPLPLTEQLEECLVGGKAASLAVATRAGLPVPVGVALPFGFVDAIAAGDAEARQQLAAIFRTLGAPLVARSSAVGEDSAQATFAGQYLTRLNPLSPSCSDAVLAIWDSARSPPHAYRDASGLSREWASSFRNSSRQIPPACSSAVIPDWFKGRDRAAWGSKSV